MKLQGFNVSTVKATCNFGSLLVLFWNLVLCVVCSLYFLTSPTGLTVLTCTPPPPLWLLSSPSCVQLSSPPVVVVSVPHSHSPSCFALYCLSQCAGLHSFLSASSPSFGFWVRHFTICFVFNQSLLLHKSLSLCVFFFPLGIPASPGACPKTCIWFVPLHPRDDPANLSSVYAAFALPFSVKA